MPHISPSIGRVVWFHPGKHLVGLNEISDKQPMKADIVYVWSDNLVNVAGFDHVGEPYRRTSVKLVQEGDAPVGDEPWCEWMPYQLDQAAKAEAAANANLASMGGMATADSAT
jgi:hypothetical protein